MNLVQLLGNSEILKQILILVAASSIKLRVKDWTILHSRWTRLLYETKCICRPLLSYC